MPSFPTAIDRLLLLLTHRTEHRTAIGTPCKSFKQRHQCVVRYKVDNISKNCNTNLFSCGVLHAPVWCDRSIFVVVNPQRRSVAFISNGNRLHSSILLNKDMSGEMIVLVKQPHPWFKEWRAVACFRYDQAKRHCHRAFMQCRFVVVCCRCPQE